MAKINEVIALLDKVRRTGESRWVACCPAHPDKSPSLSIRYIDDRILMHCFGGCGIDEIVSALDISLADLMPEKSAYSKPIKQRIPASDLLTFMAVEAGIVLMAAGDIVHGKPLSEHDLARVQIARQRLFDAVQECCR